jgi:drug/metabolite transporter (DMT)-like permease
MATPAVLMIILLATVAGDYFIKAASLHPKGLASTTFLLGMSLYALPALGWFALMKSHSLAAIAVIYSGSNIIILAALGYFIFRETITGRELVGIGLALAAILIIGEK